MASTDSPLKQLVESCITDFAAWLLQREVNYVQPLNVELPDQTVFVDQLYRVTLADNHVVKLHIEFQGPRSHEPMSLAADYLALEKAFQRISDEALLETLQKSAIQAPTLTDFQKALHDISAEPA